MEVTLLWRMGVDGRISPGADRPVSRGSEADRAHMQRLRAASDAILVGARTVAIDDPPMRVYGVDDDALPRVVVVSGRGSVSPDARLFARPGPRPWVAVVGQAPRLEAVADVQSFEEQVDLAELLQRLGAERVLCEGGGTLNRALLAAGLVDAMWVTLSPYLEGGDGALPVVGDLPASVRLSLTQSEREGDELFLRYRVER